MSIRNKFLLNLLFCSAMIYCTDGVEERAADLVTARADAPRAGEAVTYDIEHLRLSLQNTNYACLRDTLCDVAKFVNSDGATATSRHAILTVLNPFFTANQCTWQIHRQMVHVLSIFVEIVNDREERDSIRGLAQGILPMVNSEATVELINVLGRLSHHCDTQEELQSIYDSLLPMLKNDWPGVHSAAASQTFEIARRFRS